MNLGILAAELPLPQSARCLQPWGGQGCLNVGWFCATKPDPWISWVLGSPCSDVLCALGVGGLPRVPLTARQDLGGTPQRMGGTLTPDREPEWRGPAIHKGAGVPSGSHRPCHGPAALKAQRRSPALLPPCVSVCGWGEGLSAHAEPSPHFRAISHSPSWQPSPVGQLW